MLYVLAGTAIAARKKALKDWLHQKEVSLFIRKENKESLKEAIEASDMFGGQLLYVVEQLGNDKEGRDFLKENLEAMKSSVNLFILDEPLVDGTFIKTLAKHADQLIDAREEKEEGFSPFPFVELVAARKKKEAWSMWLQIRNENHEALVGALWWKLKTMWGKQLQGGGSPFSKEELEVLGEKVVGMVHKAHMGEAQLEEEIEKTILTL
jgi:hypothetical protein